MSISSIEWEEETVADSPDQEPLPELPTRYELIAARRAWYTKHPIPGHITWYGADAGTISEHYTTYKNSWETQDNNAREKLLAALSRIPSTMKKRITTAVVLGIGTLEEENSMKQLVFSMDVVSHINEGIRILYQEIESALDDPSIEFLNGLGIETRLIEDQCFNRQDLLIDNAQGSETLFFDAGLPKMYHGGGWLDFWPAIVEIGFPMLIMNMGPGVPYSRRMSYLWAGEEILEDASEERRTAMVERQRAADRDRPVSLYLERKLEELYHGERSSFEQLVLHWRKEGSKTALESKESETALKKGGE